MKKLAILLAATPLVADSFLTSVNFYSGQEIGAMLSGEDVASDLESSPNLMHHMAVLQHMYFVDLHGELDGAEIIEALEKRRGTATGDFDLGFAMVMLEFDPGGLEYLERAVKALKSPESQLGYALCLAQIDAFGPNPGDWDSPTPLKQKAVDQLIECVAMKEEWSERFKMTYAEAVDYMSLYGGYSKYSGWRDIENAVPDTRSE